MASVYAALLTYLVHSLIWAVVGLCCGRLASDTVRWQHACYKVALLGPFVSTALALMWPQPGALPVGAHAALLGRVTLRASDAWLAASGPIVVLLVAAGALRFALHAYRHWVSLRRRELVSDVAALLQLELLRARSTLRRATLTMSPVLRSPLVIGGSEICVPRWLPGALAKKELSAVFAHELSHLERGDGAWFAIVGLIESCFWFQPLNRVLAARFRASAEIACDERALTLGIGARALAQALIRVAEHGVGPGRATPWPAMARSRPEVARRIQRLLSSREAAGWSGAGPVVLLSLLALGMAPSAFGVPVGRAALPNFVQSATARELSAFDAEMLALGREQARIERELVRPDMADASPEPGRRLELEQELRHVLQKQAYVEERALAATAGTR